MTDKEYRVEKQRIRKLAKKWVRTLGLGFWHIKIEYERDELRKGKTRYAPRLVNEYYDTVMDTITDPHYLQAVITVYTLITKELDDDELEESFVHELMHVIVAPMRSDKKSDEEERVATMLARALRWTRLAGKKDK